MEIDKSIKVGDIVATNASNVSPFTGQRVFGEVTKIDFKHVHTGFYVHLLLNKKVFGIKNQIIAYPYNEPGRPYEDAYLVKATPEECEVHRTGVMPSENQEFKYRKGVWYKHESDSSFRKCSKDSNHTIPYDERITGAKHEIHTGTAHCNGVEADMNEVSKYLPDDHPDKVEEKNLKASEESHDFQIGQKFRILVDKPHSAGLSKGDIVTCFYVYGTGIIVKKDGVPVKPTNWRLDKSTIGECYEPYYGGGGICELIKSSKDEEYSPLKESKCSFGFIDQSQYKLGYERIGEPKIVFSKNDTFDPIVKAPIVI